MSKTAYLIIAIAIIVLLLVTVIVSFVVYRKTPLPKGCENMKITKDTCKNCTNQICGYSKKKENE